MLFPGVSTAIAHFVGAMALISKRAYKMDYFVKLNMLIKIFRRCHDGHQTMRQMMPDFTVNPGEVRIICHSLVVDYVDAA